MRIPIACTLTVNDAGDRLAEWTAFFAASVEAVEVADNVARARLAAGDSHLVAAAGLAEREKECCAFFDFALTLDAGSWWLRIEVPEDAAPILADLVSLAPER